MKQLLLALFAFTLFANFGKAQTIPNGGFESWNSTSFDDLDSPWVTSNNIYGTRTNTVTKVPGNSGSAVHLETYVENFDTLPGLIYEAIPYTLEPSAIHGYYRCDIASHDTGFLIVGFQKAGNILAIDTIHFLGKINTWTPFTASFALSQSPDSMAIVASSSNVLNGIDITPGSWVELDDLTFTKASLSLPLPGGSFDSWVTQTQYDPIGWEEYPFVLPGDSNGISRSTDRYAGNYSIEIVAQDFSLGSPQLTSGTFDTNYGYAAGGQPYHLTNDTLIGYYEYIPNGVDSAGIAVTLSNQSTIVYQIGKTLAPVSNWTPFAIPINSTTTPDTMRVDIYSSTNFAGTAGSTLYLDDLQLKSQPLSGIQFGSKPTFGITAFPDPAQNQLNIRFGGTIPTEFNLKIYNIEGKLLIDNGYWSGSSTITVPIDQLSSGLYFYEVTADGATLRNKFVKTN